VNPRRTNSHVGRATRDQIIAVTLETIQKEGLASLTIRQIAERAGVNVAAVNYHFGSKDALVGEVLAELTAGLRDAFGQLADDSRPARERLGQFLNEFAAVLLRYPDVYRQAIGAGLLGGEAQPQYLSFLRAEGLLLLRRLVREVTGETDERRLTLRLMQAIGGLVYPLLVGALMEPATGVRFAVDDIRRDHVEICLQNLLGPGAGHGAPGDSVGAAVKASAKAAAKAPPKARPGATTRRKARRD
jgi:AcrR family transcriptional regulator